MMPKALQRRRCAHRTSIRCPVYTLGNGAGPSNPELPSSSSSKNSCPVYMLGTQRCWTHSKVSLSKVRITRTNNGVRMAVKICIFVVRITRTNNGVRMAVKICSPGTWVFWVVNSFQVRITRTNNGVRMAVKICIFVVRITRTNNGVQMAVKICSLGEVEYE